MDSQFHISSLNIAWPISKRRLSQSTHWNFKKMPLPSRLIVTALMVCCVCIAGGETLARQRHHSSRHRSARKSAKKDSKSDTPSIVGKQLRLNDGSVFTVDDAWEDTAGIWYRKNGVTQLLEKTRVRTIERGDHKEAAAVDEKVVAVA